MPDFDLSNIYDVSLRVAPGLQDCVERFEDPAGPVCDQMQLAVPGTRTR